MTLLRARALAGSLLLLIVLSDVWTASAQQKVGIAAPEEIAIEDQGDKGLAVRHFPTGLHVYTFDHDSVGVSTCLDGCASAWPPVRAPIDAKPVGDWTLVTRIDGRKQWAYKGKPLYLRYHDTANAAAGDGIDGVWHAVGNIPKTASR